MATDAEKQKIHDEIEKLKGFVEKAKNNPHLKNQLATFEAKLKKAEKDYADLLHEEKSDEKGKLKESIVKLEEMVTKAKTNPNLTAHLPKFEQKLKEATDKLKELEGAETPAAIDKATENAATAAKSTETAAEKLEAKVDATPMPKGKKGASKKTPAAKAPKKEAKPSAKKQHPRQEQQKKKAHQKKVKGIMADLKKLVASSKKLRGHYGKTPGHDLEVDAMRSALPPGKRKSKSGETYFESRSNRSDIRKTKKWPKLEDGGPIDTFEAVKSGGIEGAGMFAKGGEVHRHIKKNKQNPAQSESYSKRADKKRTAKPVGFRWTDEGAKRLKKKLGIPPSKADIEKYSGKTFKDRKGQEHRYLYEEARKDKSDKSRREKFAKGGTVKGSKEFQKLYDEAYDIFNKHINNEGDMDYSEKEYSYLSDLLDEVEIGYLKKPADGDHQQELEDEKFTMTEKDAIKSLQHRIDSIKEKFAKGGNIKQNPAQSGSYSKRADKMRKAKPVGFRWTDAAMKKLGKTGGAHPSATDIEKYFGKTFKDHKGEEHRYLYEEARKDKSDKSRRKRYEDGGTMGAGSF